MNEQSQMMNSHHQMLPPHMMQPSYGQWPQPPLPPGIMNAMNFSNNLNPMFVSNSKIGRNNWKGKKPMDKQKSITSRSMNVNNASNVSNNVVFDVEQQNRGKGRRYYQHKKKFFNRMGPYAHAPRNTTSYLIRAKKAGGIASLVSPCPVTPAVLPTPVFSPSKEAVVDMAKEEWGVDGYGSMKGLIRLRSPGCDEREDDYDEEEEEGGGCGSESSESDVEEHVEVERRLDHDLSRFEMIYPNASSGVDHHNLLESRVDDQDTHIARLEEENVVLKDRVYYMERELGDMRRRLSCLERRNQVVEDINQEVVENESGNSSDEIRNVPLLVNRENEEVDFVPRNWEKRDNNDEMWHEETTRSYEQCAAVEANNCKDGLLGNEPGIVMAVDNKDIDNDREAKVLNNKSEIIFKVDETMVDTTKAEDTSNRLGNNVFMGDVESTNRDLVGHKFDD